MAHTQQRNFCERAKEKYPEYFTNKKVLDIGSLDINGSNRDLFTNCDYTGIDIGEGKNVDVVSVGHLFQGPNNYYDTIISTEVFEHDMFYPLTIQNVMRMLKPGGLFLFTCAAPGRPEHGTRRTGAFDAPLLLGISEEWADYYKNLTPDDIIVVPGFNETFPDAYFEMKNEHPYDLYFYGIKKEDETKSLVKYFQFTEDIFVIDCWPDNKEKEKVLIELINKVKVYGCPIILCGHYAIKPEIQKLVDYYIYDKNNDILLEKDFEEYGVNSDRWTDMGNLTLVNKTEFHHDYAIWLTMKNAFTLANQLGKKYIHFLEYDNLPEEIQYRQAFMEYVRNWDAVMYEYTEGSTRENNPYCSAYIFSIKTDVAIKMINLINSKEEYFKNKPDSWQLEKQLYQSIRKVTDRTFASKYISNNNELNIFAAWNRNGILKGGARFQTYLGVDEKNNLYIHFISGFSEKPADKDYLVEIIYNGSTNFFKIKKGEYHLGILGEYQQYQEVQVLYQGIEIFSQKLNKNITEFRRKNKVIRKNVNTNRRININYIDGAYVEILEDGDFLYHIQFINKDTNAIEYETNIKSNHWCAGAKKYKINWLIKIKGIDNDYFEEIEYNAKNKRVLIAYETKSLGDTLAFFPYVEKFRKENNCEVIVSTFHNYLFKNQYPKIQFVEPGSTVPNLYALYRLGLFLRTDNGIRQYDFEKHPSDPKPLPLMKLASDILGLEYEEIKPKLKKLGKYKRKRVCIGVHSTAQAKYWNNPTGWQDVTDYLTSKGYEVRILSKEEDGYMGNKNPIGAIQQPPSDLEEIIRTLEESELFIGISSGLSWLAWAANVPTIIISGFTDDDLEPKNGVIRIINKDVCTNCWGRHEFDAGDWNWCPDHKGTNRQFECSKSISSQDVIKQIESQIF